MRTLTVKFEYADLDDLLDAIEGLGDCVRYGYSLDYTYDEEDDSGKSVIKYRRTCEPGILEQD